MTRDEMVALLKEEVKGLTSYLVDPTDYENSIDDASRETWDLPQSTDFKVYWVKNRAKRHLFFYLASASASKFKAKKFNLNEKFDHFYKMIDYMDEEFRQIQEDRPDEFADVDTFDMFGTRVTAGFASDQIGRDTTYTTDNDVMSSPNESS